jgi:flagellar FliL protein
LLDSLAACDRDLESNHGRRSCRRSSTSAEKIGRHHEYCTQRDRHLRAVPDRSRDRRLHQRQAASAARSEAGKDGKITAIVPVVVAAKKEEKSGPPKPAVYYAIDPPLVVNFEDGSAVRFLQISMEIMAHDEKVIDSVQKNNPVIRNNLLLLMNYQSLMSREGKEKLRQEALTEIRAVQKKEGSPDVDDLLFTSFVVQ